MRRIRNPWRPAGWGLLLMFTAAAALMAQSPRQVRVKDPQAVIRVSADTAAAPAAAKADLGSVFDVDRKLGAWYEIKYLSPIGVRLTGYIHQSQVEELKPAPAERRRTEDDVPSFESPLRSGFEFSLSGGMGFNTFHKNTMDYIRTLPTAANLEVAIDTGSIAFNLGNPIPLTLSGQYFFTPNLGIRLSVDLPLGQSLTSTLSNYGLVWIWSGSESDSWMKNWPTTGTYTVLPVSLNGVWRFALGPIVTTYFTAGATYFHGSLKIDSSIGYGDTWTDTAQLLDFFTIPVKIDSSVSGIGFNAGVGLDAWVNRSMSIFIEAAYFGGPKGTGNWTVQAGPYASNMVSGYTLTDATLPARVAAYLTPVSYNLSNFRFVAGIKIAL
jgi:hypothetical protein